MFAHLQFPGVFLALDGRVRKIHSDNRTQEEHYHGKVDIDRDDVPPQVPKGRCFPL